MPLSQPQPTIGNVEEVINKPFEEAKPALRGSSGKFEKSESLDIKCRFCGSSNVVKFGYNRTKEGNKARYKCKECNTTFTPTSKLNKPIKFESNQKDIEQAKTDELKIFCKLIKKTIYPFLDFKMGCTAKYDTNTFLEFFTYIAVNHEFAHNGAETFTLAQCASNKNKKEKEDIPASNTFLYHIVKFDVEELRKDFKEAFEEIFEMAKKGEVFKKRRLDIAVDLHDWLYYGDKNDPMVVRTKSKDGTTCCFRFATVNIVESGRRFTLLALPMGPFDNKDKILEELINYAKSKISIRNVYVDRGFFTVKCISALEELKVKWLMPAVRNKAIKKLMEKYDAPKVLDYVMGDKRYQHKHIEFRLVILNDKDGIKRVFATNLGVTEDNAGLLFQEYSNRCDDDLLFKEYGKRWGIETSYRVKKHEFRARTTSKKYVVRLFYFMFSTCLYNLWVLGNILISSAILKFVPKKPFITARTFGVTLCLDYLFSDP